MEAFSGTACTRASRLSRRDLDKDQYVATAGMAPARREAPCQGSSRPLENPDLRGGVALQTHRCAVRLRRSNQRRKFQAYVEQVLAPALRPGNIVVMDNPGSHKGSAIRRAIRAARAHLLFLPPYSPDLNPIEQVFAKLKTLLRKAEERTVDGLWRRIGGLLDTFTPGECANYLQNAGYASI